MSRTVQILLAFIARTTRYAVLFTAISATVFLLSTRMTNRTKFIRANTSVDGKAKQQFATFGNESSAQVPTNPEDGTVKRMTEQRKTILLWNPFFGEPDYGVGGFGTTAFERSNCEHTCWLTNDKSQLPYSDAVVVHVYNMGPQYQNVTMPIRHSQNQIFVFFILESPLRSYKGFFNAGFSFKDVFNLTFTFLDSDDTDVYTPLGGLAQREEPLEQLMPSEDSVAKKSLVAWFVSNCNAPSARIAYAKELAKYIPIHVYGSCGNYSCPPGNISCYNSIIQSYMFYLAFENSFCKDYATEKLFRTLTTNMVPIVYGYANYSKLVPVKAFIDVRDFSSPKRLAEYLLTLKETPKKYLRYLSWKRKYSVLQEGDFKASGFCQLCNILHTDDYPYKTNYDPVEEYWNPDKLCLLGEEERRTVHLDK